MGKYVEGLVLCFQLIADRIYSAFKNPVLGARSEIFGYAVEI
jgi:hypothetical protein